MRKMSNHAGRSAFLLFVMISFPVFAQMSLSPLNATEVRSNLFGQLMSGEYPDGSQWSERFNHDGTSIYAQNGQTYASTMTLNGNILCFKYGDPAFSGGCFEIWKRGLNCFDFYATNNSANFDDRRFGRSWSARGWYPGKPKTCVSENIS